LHLASTFRENTAHRVESLFEQAEREV